MNALRSTLALTLNSTAIGLAIEARDLGEAIDKWLPVFAEWTGRAFVATVPTYPPPRFCEIWQGSYRW